MVTQAAAPSRTLTSATTRPAGVSSRTRVTGSVTCTMPVSTRTVATPMVPCPHIGRHPDTSMKITPQSASARLGACRMAPLIHESLTDAVQVPHEVPATVEHRVTGDGTDAADDDPGGHSLGVRVDGV